MTLPETNNLCIFGMTLFMALGGCAPDPHHFLKQGELMRAPETYLGLKYAVTVRQRFDYSCGGAAMATILTHYWGRPTQEIEVLDLLRSRYPKESWQSLQESGFSMEDLIWVARSLGFEGQAASLPSSELARVDGPIIVHLDKGKFQHFSVLRKRTRNRTYLSDPVLGMISMLNEEFDHQYTGAALAVWRPSAALPRTAILGQPYPMLDPSTVYGGLGRFREPDYAKAY